MSEDDGRDEMERLRRDYPLTADSLVVDVGAYRGDFTFDMRRLYDCRVTAVEPIAGHVMHLRSRFGHDPKVTILETALGFQDGTIELKQDGDLSGPYAKGVPLQAKLTDAAKIISEPIALLKLNVEGAEYDILERLYITGKMPLIRFLQVQFHPWGDMWEERHERARKRLAEMHTCDWRVPMVWESWSRMLCQT